MGREEQIIEERLKKIKELEKKKINPYPNSFDKKDSANECLKIKLGSKVKTAGRLMTKRELGKIAFAKLRDSSGDIQLVFQDGKTPDKIFGFFKEYIDAGDFAGVEGETFKTKTGEISILVKKIELLSKAILPLPEKFHGLQDDEEKFRKRYLDIITNPEVGEMFKKRGETIKAIRDFLNNKGFLEVETPVLQPLYGGANAKPFITHYNVYNKDVYLRIAPELYLKRLIVAGFEKVFEFARCFRNEGADWSHNPEFSLLEFYQAYIDYNELMKMTEELIIEVVKKVNGKAEIKRDEKNILIKKPFKKITFKELTKGKMTDEAFKEAVRKIKEPTFVINHPLDISPLAKKNDEKTVQRFQLIIDGIEVVNAFSELNDPIDQEERFREQEKRKSEEKHKFDKDFVEALKHGMPPTGGFGMGIDRFVMLITGSHSIREILLFPFMKPEKE
ncbi:OB-fold nucleic acid binding domain-containing protein [Candidatus Pacearchaeota archaeon]|nr:OB-fold nucleic acid binding domain-containing protein [Candidatus Pacearchaeota archaeon]